ARSFRGDRDAGESTGDDELPRGAPGERRAQSIAGADGAQHDRLEPAIAEQLDLDRGEDAPREVAEGRGRRQNGRRVRRLIDCLRGRGRRLGPSYPRREREHEREEEATAQPGRQTFSQGPEMQRKNVGRAGHGRAAPMIPSIEARFPYYRRET